MMLVPEFDASLIPAPSKIGLSQDKIKMPVAHTGVTGILQSKCLNMAQCAATQAT